MQVDMEWLKRRQTGVGGSDIAALMGMAPEIDGKPSQTPLTIYLQKVAKHPVIMPENEKMYWGKILEEPVAQEFAKRTGLKIRKSSKFYRHKEYPFIIGNVDRLITGPRRGVLEVKTTNDYYRRRWKDEVPANYYLQLQHYLLLTDREWGAIALLSSGQKFEFYSYERDEDVIEAIVAACVDFWAKVQSAEPPDPETKEDLQRLYPQALSGKELEARDELAYLVEEVRVANVRSRELDKIKSKKIVQIQAAMGDAEILTHHGEVIATWKNSPNQTITETLSPNQAALRSLLAKSKPKRRFIVKQ